MKDSASPTSRCGRCRRWTWGRNRPAAVRLFIERAHNVAPQFSPPNPDEVSAVLTICRRLDDRRWPSSWRPRMVSMSAVEVRDRLDDRFRLLVGSRRSPVPPPDAAPRRRLVL